MAGTDWREDYTYRDHPRSHGVGHTRRTIDPDIPRPRVDIRQTHHRRGAARELTELGFEWLEEPLPQSGYVGYPELRSNMDLPLAGGETLTTRHAGHESLQRGCFDIIQPDVSICGGIAECLFIGELARLSAVRCIPHCWAGAITFAATMQLCALLPEVSRMDGVDSPLLEYDVTENPFRDLVVVGDPFALRDGCVALPTLPGLGVEIDEQALRRYAV